jgi:hypothetical protein
MGILDWVKGGKSGKHGGDRPPASSLMNAAFNREPANERAMGDMDTSKFDESLAGLLTRRQQVSDELLSMEITTVPGRREAVPRLRELLRVYPHPLVYETLIHAYIDAERYDEARGVAFAARERRIECEHSPHPEIRAEIDRLNEWTPEEVDAVRLERQGGA